MKITRVRICKGNPPYADGPHVFGTGNAITAVKASVVVIDTSAGLRACGQFTTCRESCMNAHSSDLASLDAPMNEGAE